MLTEFIAQLAVSASKGANLRVNFKVGFLTVKQGVVSFTQGSRITGIQSDNLSVTSEV
jgi:hypothetical protein